MHSHASLAAPYRYAIYFAPQAGSPWDLAGCQWLGRCAATGHAQAQPTINAVPAPLQVALTAEPRRYGWHATLKAPFVARPGENAQSVRACLQALARDHRAFTLPPLRVSVLGDFLALRPAQDSPPLRRVAEACVTRLQPLAQPLGPEELARRRKTTLSVRQEQLLLQWGYPWVLEEFRFHFSLTGRLSDTAPTARDALFQAAVTRFESLPACRFDRLALFVEPTPGADFIWLDEVELAP